MKHVTDHPSAVGLGDDVDIVQVGEDVFVREQTILDFGERLVYAKAEKHRHQGVPLFSAFCLLHPPASTVLVLPTVRRLMSVDGPHEGQQPA